MLLFVNLVLGMISRVAAQINVFSVGFPITLGVGLLGMLLTLPAMQQPFTMALERMLSVSPWAPAWRARCNWPSSSSASAKRVPGSSGRRTTRISRLGA
jgi:hypothetical protein